jgi:hypothetical protein
MFAKCKTSKRSCPAKDEIAVPRLQKALHFLLMEGGNNLNF